MDYAYSYSARTGRGQLIQGTVYAPSKALAFAKLKRGGFQPVRVGLSVGDTLRGLVKPSFDRTELARFYKTLGRRVVNGKQMVEGLEAAAEYIQDPRLRQAVMLMRQALMDGQNEYGAMMAAGFPRRDCMVVRSVAESGKTGETFQTMGEELAQSESVRRAMASTFRMPALMAVFMVLFIWAALMFIAPATLSFLKQTGLRLNFSPLLNHYFDFVRLFHKSALLSSVIYFACFGALVVFIRSSTFRRFLDRSRLLRDLSMKSDHTTLWNSFCLLYDAGIPAREAAKIVGDAAKREDSRRAFHRLSRLVEAGRSVEDAVAAAAFPPFIVSGVASAISAGDTVVGLKEMVASLEEDVRVLSGLMQENAKIVSIVAVAAGILLVFFLTYFPMLASVLSNV